MGERPEEIMEPVDALSGSRRQCPHCGSDQLMVVTTKAVMGCDQAQNILCTACSRCWHTAGGRLEQVDRYLCPGCPERLRCFQPLIYGGRPVPPDAADSSTTHETRGGL